jgi:hypothetical protein
LFAKGIFLINKLQVMKTKRLGFVVLLCFGFFSGTGQLLNDVTAYPVPAKQGSLSPRLRSVFEAKLFPADVNYTSFLDYPFSNTVVRYGAQYHLGNRNNGVYLKSAIASYNSFTSHAGSLPRNTFVGSLAYENHLLLYTKTPNKKTLQLGMVMQNFLHPVTDAFFMQPATAQKSLFLLMGLGAKQ